MEPREWWRKVLDWLWVPYLWTQCEAELPCRAGVAFCQKRKGHRGRHVTFNGEHFDAATSTRTPNT